MLLARAGSIPAASFGQMAYEVRKMKTILKAIIVIGLVLVTVSTLGTATGYLQNGALYYPVVGGWSYYSPWTGYAYSPSMGYTQFGYNPFQSYSSYWGW